MKRVLCLFCLRYTFIPVIICILSVGCVGNFKKKSKESVPVINSSEVEELKIQNNNLINEINLLKESEKDNERIKRIAEVNLVGTGITVRTKNDGLVSLMLPSSAFFAMGKASLKKSAKSNLKKVSTVLNQQFYENVVRIEGHTDNQPILNKKRKYKSNWELSVARSLSVLQYFIEECGVNPSNLYVAGFGEYEPIASNSSKSGRDENRRVEIVIIP